MYLVELVLALMVIFIVTCTNTVQAAETDREWNYTDTEEWKLGINCPSVPNVATR